MNNLTSFGPLAIFSDELASPCVCDPFIEVSDLIRTDGLQPGTMRISTYKEVDGDIIEDKPLIKIEVL